MAIFQRLFTRPHQDQAKGQGNHDAASLESKASSQNQEDSAASPQLDRRSLFDRGGLGALSVALLAACSKGASFGSGNKRSASSQRNAADNASGADAAGDEQGPGHDNTNEAGHGDANADANANGTATGNGTLPKTNSSDSLVDQCSPLNNNQLNLNKLNAASGDLVPMLKFYGSSHNAMVVVDYDKYTMSDTRWINKIILTHTNGKIIAVRVLTAADQAPAKRLWSIVHDHINLKGASKIVVIAVLQDDSYHKYEMSEAIGFEDSFQGKPVAHLGDLDMVPANFHRFQAIPNFKDTGVLQSDGTKKGFLPAPTDKYNFSKGRKLYTAQDNVSYSAAAALAAKDYVIVDLMGRDLGKGSSFNNIIDYPCFIAYLPAKRVTNGNSISYEPAKLNETFEQWVRTIVKVG